MIHCWLRYGLEDCSSVATFKGVCESLEVCQPTAFLLENVDSLESKQQKGTPEETPSRVLVFLFRFPLARFALEFSLSDQFAICHVHRPLLPPPPSFSPTHHQATALFEHIMWYQRSVVSHVQKSEWCQKLPKQPLHTVHCTVLQSLIWICSLNVDNFSLKVQAV